MKCKQVTRLLLLNNFVYRVTKYGTHVLIFTFVNRFQQVTRLLLLNNFVYRVTKYGTHVLIFTFVNRQTFLSMSAFRMPALLESGFLFWL